MELLATIGTSLQVGTDCRVGIFPRHLCSARRIRCETPCKVVFDRYVVVRRQRGGPQVALTIGGQTRLAAYLGARGAGGIGGVRDLFFRYEVQESDVDADGISIPANAVRLNGETITSEANRTVNADLTHAAVTADATRKVDGSKVRGPSVTDVFFVGEPEDGKSYRTGETIGVAVRLDPLAKIDGTAPAFPRWR